MQKLLKIIPIKNAIKKTIIVWGRITFHAIIINLSYRYRTYVPRTKININIINNIIILLRVLKPKNIKFVKILIAIIIPYSDIKMRAKSHDPYSILNPETNSDSPSAKSNGERFVSAKQINIQTKNKKENLKIVIQFS